MAQTYHVDRNLRTSRNNQFHGRAFRGYGNRGSSSRNFSSRPNWRKKKVTWNVCIVCKRQDCHSSNHVQLIQRAFQNIARAYLDGDEEEDNGDTEINDYESEEEGEYEYEAEYFVSFVRRTSAIGMSPKITKNVADAALIETGSSTLSTVGFHLI